MNYRVTRVFLIVFAFVLLVASQAFASVIAYDDFKTTTGTGGETTGLWPNSPAPPTIGTSVMGAAGTTGGSIVGFTGNWTSNGTGSTGTYANWAVSSQTSGGAAPGPANYNISGGTSCGGLFFFRNDQAAADGGAAPGKSVYRAISGDTAMAVGSSRYFSFFLDPGLAGYAGTINAAHYVGVAWCFGACTAGNPGTTGSPNIEAEFLPMQTTANTNSSVGKFQLVCNGLTGATTQTSTANLSTAVTYWVLMKVTENSTGGNDTVSLYYQLASSALPTSEPTYQLTTGTTANTDVLNGKSVQDCQFNTLDPQYEVDVLGALRAGTTFADVAIPGAPTATFSASPTSIVSTQSSTLTWTTTNATSVSINQGVGTVTPVASGSTSVSPTTTTTYTLTATGWAGTATQTATVTVNAGPAINSFTATPTSITAGGSATLAWTTTNATTVSIDNGVNTSGKNVAGDSVSVSPTTTTTYTLTATNGTQVTATATVTVVPAPVIGSFSASSPSITAGGATTLSWTTSNATSVNIDNGVSTSGKNVAGDSVSVSPTTTTAYTLTALNSLSSSVTATVTVTVVPAAVITSFFASPTTIVTGQSSTLTWTTTNAASAGIDQGVGTVATSGNASVSPTTTTTYTLTAANSLSSSVTSPATVTVLPILTITPTSASVPSGHTQSFSANIAGATFMATLGSVTVGGLYTAPVVASTTTDTVTVTSGSGITLQTASATVTVSPYLAITSVLVTVVTGQKCQFSTPNFTGAFYSATLGTITSTGLYTAPAETAVMTDTVTATWGTSPVETATATVTIEPILSVTSPATSVVSGATLTFTANTPATFASSPLQAINATNTTTAVYTAPTESSITTDTVSITTPGGQSATVTVTVIPVLTISPTSVSLISGQTQQFNTNIAGVTWSSTLNAINASGLYTAPSSGSSDTVSVTYGTQTKTATVTIIPVLTITTPAAAPYYLQVNTGTVSLAANVACNWTVTSGGGSLSATSNSATTTYTASGETAGTPVVITASATGQTSVTVTLTPVAVPTLSSINICGANGSMAYTVTVTGSPTLSATKTSTYTGFTLTTPPVSGANTFTDTGGGPGPATFNVTATYTNGAGDSPATLALTSTPDMSVQIVPLTVAALDDFNTTSGTWTGTNGLWPNSPAPPTIGTSVSSADGTTGGTIKGFTGNWIFNGGGTGVDTSSNVAVSSITSGGAAPGPASYDLSGVSTDGGLYFVRSNGSTYAGTKSYYRTITGDTAMASGSTRYLSFYLCPGLASTSAPSATHSIGTTWYLAAAQGSPSISAQFLPMQATANTNSGVGKWTLVPTGLTGATTQTSTANLATGVTYWVLIKVTENASSDTISMYWTTGAPPTTEPTYLLTTTATTEGLSGKSVQSCLVSAVNPGSTEVDVFSALCESTYYPILPGTPTGATATITGGTTASLSWTAPAAGIWPVTGYTALASTSASFTSPIYVTVSGTTATFTGLALGTQYYFEVMALNAVGNGMAGASVTATTLNVPTVDTPTSASVTTNSATLGATIENNGGQTITAAGVAYGTSANPTAPGTTTTTFSGAFTVPVTGLSPNTLYNYRGYATSSVGTGYAANTTFTTLPGVPTAVTATATGSTTASLTWTAPTGNATITGYTAQASTDGVGFSNPIAGTVTGTTATFTGLTPVTQYFFQVQATNAGGTGAWSASATTTTWTTPTVDTPTATAIAANTATLGATIESNGGTTIIAAGVAYGTSPSPYTTGTLVTSSAASGAFTVSVTGLTSDTFYYYCGYATNGVGTVYTADATFTTVPSAPTGVTATATGPTTASLNWTAPTGPETITGYTVLQSTDDAMWSAASGTITDTSDAITGLTPDTLYYFTVVATNAGGNSASSTLANTVTWGPPTVDTPTAAAITTTTVTLGATIESSNNGGAVTAAGVVYGTTANPDITGAAVASAATAGAFTVPVTGLVNDTLYHYRGYATNGLGTGYTADTTFVTAVDVPTNLNTSNPTAAGFTITWNPAANDGGGSPVTYTVNIATDIAFTNIVQTSTTTTTTTATGLAPNTTYYVEVSGFNGSGSASAFAGANGSVSQMTLTMPTASLTAAPLNINPGGSCTLTWATTLAGTAVINNGVGPVSPLAGGSVSVTPTVTTTYTLTVTGNGVTVTATATVTVIPAPVITTFTATPATIVPGQTATLAWTTSYATDTTIDTNVGAVTPAASGSVSVNPPATTTYTLTATNLLGVQIAASTTVTLTTLAITSPTSVTLASGSTATFTANVSGVSWTASAGTITPAGVFTAPTESSVTTVNITASAGTQTAPATVTVIPMLTITPASVSLTTGSTQTFTTNLSGATWTATLGTVDSTGLYTAPVETSLTTDTVTATETTLGVTQTATATVSVDPILAITPASAYVNAGGTQTFTSYL